MQKKICSLFSNSWQKETRATKDKIHIVHPEAARGYRNTEAAAAAAAAADDDDNDSHFTVDVKHNKCPIQSLQQILEIKAWIDTEASLHDLAIKEIGQQLFELKS